MKKILIALWILLCAVIWVAIGELCSAMSITVLDVGQGDSILIESDTQNILIDTGPPSSRETFMSQISGIERIDKLILTHPHADHVGNAFYLIENKPVGMAYDNGEISASSYYLNYLAGLSMENIGHVSLKAGDTLKFDDAVLEVLNPSETFDTNNNSLVMRLVYGNFSMLFTGDIGFLAEAEMMSRGGNLRSTILKAAHHGSKTSSSYNFIRAVKPEVVVISCGKGNRFGHPSAEALTAFTQFTDKIFCTAYNGSIYINTDGETYSIAPKFSGDWVSNAAKSSQITLVEKLD